MAQDQIIEVKPRFPVVEYNDIVKPKEDPVPQSEKLFAPRITEEPLQRVEELQLKPATEAQILKAAPPIMKKDISRNSLNSSILPSQPSQEQLKLKVDNQFSKFLIVPPQQD